MDRVKTAKTILWAIVGLGISVGITRFVFGLGATTNLTDLIPWGLWIGFDVVSGVALAAGGFVITAVFYILKKDEFHPIVRPAVLTAFLGYIAVIVGLMADLGAPWNIWRPVVHWQHHSALFEVAWCVMLYTTVLALEFSPVPLESTSRYAKIRSFLLKYRLVFVILGIMLSTLHQSSLGSLFLIMPYRLHPLWHTPMIPVLFFISAVGLGLMMVVFEGLVTSYLYRRPPEMNLVSKLGKWAGWVLSLYLLVRLGDIIIAGKLQYLFAWTWESYLFVGEMLVATILPVALLSVRRIRESLAGMWTCASLVVFGFILNRIDTSGITTLRTTGSGYFPAWSEFAISAAVVSAAALAFLFAVERFKVWEVRPRDPEDDVEYPPQFDYASAVWLGRPAVAARAKYSMVFVLAMAFGFAVLPGDTIRSAGVDPTPVAKARGGDTLTVDGNRDHYAVLFKHQFHIDTLRGGCASCHHLNRPGDKNTGCWECHKDMYLSTDAFGHDWHTSQNGGNLSCDRCHTGGENRNAGTADSCRKCHDDLLVPGATVHFTSYQAPGYVDAMHGMCITCHKNTAARVNRPDLGRCATCHRPETNRILAETESGGRAEGRVVIPGRSAAGTHNREIIR